jgi:hypothetical protein
MLDKLFSESLLHTGAHVGYFSGLTMLLPILGDAWEKSVRPWIVSPHGFLIALGLILLSIIVLAFVAGSITGLIKGMGWMMFIPGILAVIFAGFGQANVYGWAGQHVTGFVAAEPVVNWFVDHAVPKVAYVGGFYIIVGIVLIWIGRRIESVTQFI